MSEPLLCGTKDLLQAIRRQKLKVVVGLLTGHATLQPLEPTCLNSDSHRGRIAYSAGMKGVMVYILYAIGTGM